MLEFINNNGVLFSGMFGVITALITSIVAIIIDKRKAKKDTIKSLKKELEDTKKELSQYIFSENAEQNIDKRTGSIYTEKLPNGGDRNICGYCWEKEHIKIPIIVNMCEEEFTYQKYYSGYCQSCKTNCIENIEEDFSDKLDSNASDFEGELPF